MSWEPTSRAIQAVSGFDYRSSSLELNDVELSMPGRHQQINAAIAIAATECLIRNGWDIKASKIRQGLLEAMLPGRCELVAGRKLVVLDIAHNPASMKALCDTLQCINPFVKAQKKTLIVAVSREKDLPGMLEPVLEIFDHFVVTKYLDNPRARSCREVRECLINLLKRQQLPPERVEIIESPQEAWNSVYQSAHENHSICIAGSVFLIAELRTTVLKSREIR